MIELGTACYLAVDMYRYCPGLFRFRVVAAIIGLSVAVFYYSCTCAESTKHSVLRCARDDAILVTDPVGMWLKTECWTLKAASFSLFVMVQAKTGVATWSGTTLRCLG